MTSNWLGVASLRAGKIDRKGRIDYAEGDEPFTYRHATPQPRLFDAGFRVRTE